MSIWSVPDWQKRQSVAASNAILCISGDGTALATMGWKEGIQVWNTATWEPLIRPNSSNQPLEFVEVEITGEIRRCFYSLVCFTSKLDFSPRVIFLGLME
ncbi:MAG: hypothetical protein AB9869_33600 [Verrucomicrobiia bacterium]